MRQLVQFILVPDSGAARRLRRILAGQCPHQGVLVGTWPELVEQAESAYLFPSRASDWERSFHAALEKVSGAFWARSFQVSPEETAAEVEAALSLLVGATEPSSRVSTANSDRLSGRTRRHVQDIVRLLGELDGELPDDLRAIQQLLVADSNNAIRNIAVCRMEGFPALTRWQAALIDKLNVDAGVEPGVEMRSFLQSMLFDVSSTSIPPKTSLQALQKYLFSMPKDRLPLDDSVQWLGVRDFLEEAEISTGMIQRMLDRNPELKLSDIGLLIPESFEYSLAIGDAFSAAGLPLSGLPVDRWRRDLGREALFHFLYCRRKPSPAMALAVCLSSPLMPWPKERGADLAQAVMNGDYRLKPFHSATNADRQMLDLLRDGDETPHTLAGAIRSFVTLLQGDDQLASHVHQARAMAVVLCTSLENMADIDWVALRRLSNPENIGTGESSDFNLEGITVWRETQEPWRPVRYPLSVAGRFGVPMR